MLTLSLLSPPSPVATHKSPPKSCFKCTCICLNENVCSICPTSSLIRFPQLVCDAGPGGCLCVAHVWMSEVIGYEAFSSSRLCFSVGIYGLLSVFFCVFVLFFCSFAPFRHLVSFLLLLLFFFFFFFLCSPRTSGSYFRGTRNMLCVFIHSFVLFSSEFSARL